MTKYFMHQGYRIKVEKRGDRYYAYRADGLKGSVAKGNAGSYEEFMANSISKTTQFDRTSYESMGDNPEVINIRPRSPDDSNYVVKVQIKGRDSHGRIVDYYGYSQPFRRREAFTEAREEAESVGKKNMIESVGLTPVKVGTVSIERYTPLISR